MSSAFRVFCVVFEQKITPLVLHIEKQSDHKEEINLKKGIRLLKLNAKYKHKIVRLNRDLNLS